jgi:hypothetical protein
MLEKDEETGNTIEKTLELQLRIDRHNNQCPMMTFDSGGPDKNRRRTDPSYDVDDRGTGGGTGGSALATECAELEAHGYEVESQDVMDESGCVMMEPIMKVGQLLSTYARR